MSLALVVLVGVLVSGMLLRMPIGFSMLASGFGYLLVKRQDLGLVAEQVSNGLYNSYVLLAVPLFVFAANVMNAGTVSERIFDFCRILVGRMRGGLAQVDILVSVVFSGMSGSAIADAAGPGLVTIRQMLNKPEYPRGFAGAVVVASATILERVKGIEPSYEAWEAAVLPLNYTRTSVPGSKRPRSIPCVSWCRISRMATCARVVSWPDSMRQKTCSTAFSRTSPALPTSLPKI
jgi:hypothetical protein